MKRAVALTVAGAFALAACGDDGGGSVEAFCESVQEVADNTADPFDTDSSEDFVAELEKQRDAVNAAADNAPDEISDDAQTAAEWFAEVSDALAAVDPTDQAALDEPSALFVHSLHPVSST